jgi:hypothetical protein
MKTFELMFSASKTLPPLAQICLKSWTTGHREITPRITEECGTLKEFEAAIERLKKELDELKAEARQCFSEDNTSHSN